jgi:molybdopterin-containing oxidoreductase family membrane subunit
MFFLAVLIQVGMWTERYMILMPVLSRSDFMPSTWGTFHPTIFDWSTFIGTIGFFCFGFVVFVRFFPLMSIHELMELSHISGGGKHKPKTFSPRYAK